MLRSTRSRLSAALCAVLVASEGSVVARVAAEAAVEVEVGAVRMVEVEGMVVARVVVAEEEVEEGMQEVEVLIGVEHALRNLS